MDKSKKGLLSKKKSNSKKELNIGFKRDLNLN